jgi:hypothetical protein
VVGWRLTPEQTLPVLDAHGTEPLEPYPGNVLRASRVRCRLCGAESAPNFKSSQHLDNTQTNDGLPAR